MRIIEYPENAKSCSDCGLYLQPGEDKKCNPCYQGAVERKIANGYNPREHRVDWSGR
jgi:hypothetical protein